MDPALDGRLHLSSWPLRRMIKAGIQEDRCRRPSKAGSAVESLPASDTLFIQEAWICMWVWYKDAVYRTPPPDRVTITTMTTERVEIYQHVPPPGEIIPVGDILFLMDDVIPEDEEIAWEVRRLCLNRSGGPSGMRAEHLRQWLIAATQDDSPDATN